MSDREYARFWENRNTHVGIILTDVWMGAAEKRGDSGNLKLDAIVCGETEENLILEDVISMDTEADDEDNTTYTGCMTTIRADEAMVKKELIAVIYKIREDEEEDSAQ